MSRLATEDQSEQHHAAGRRSPPCPKRTKDLRAVDGQQVAEDLAMLGQEPTMVIGSCEHQQYHGGTRVVALLQPKTTLQRLCVCDVRLPVRDARRATVGDQRVPCPQVAGNRPSDLALNGEWCAEHRQQTLEESQLPSVAQRRRDGIEL